MFYGKVKRMRNFFYHFWINAKRCFSGANLLWHLLAVALTYVLVVSGFDWQYYLFWNGTRLSYMLFSAALVGGLMPLFAPLGLLVWGRLKRNKRLLNTGFAIGQAAILGSLISSFYKMLTGRAHPDLLHVAVFSDIGRLSTDITTVFKFGILRGGIFWGWPSSHTTLAFAMAVTLIILYPKNKIILYDAFLYAFYIGIGVSMTIHWFSDFVAGAIIGTVIGVVVGRSFLKKYQQ